MTKRACANKECSKNADARYADKRMILKMILNRRKGGGNAAFRDAPLCTDLIRRSPGSGKKSSLSLRGHVLSQCQDTCISTVTSTSRLGLMSNAESYCCKAALLRHQE